MSALIGDPRVFVSELIWTVINFVLLMLLLRRFLFRPVLQILEKRRAGVEEKLRVEQDALKQAEENRGRLEAEKEKSREEAKELLNRSAGERDARHTAALAEARAEAERTREAGEAVLQQKREAEQAQLQEAAPELAEVLAARLLNED